MLNEKQMRNTPTKRSPRIEVRKPQWTFSELVGQKPRSDFGRMMFGAMSLVFPEGERFFIRSVKHFAAQINDKSLAADVKNFIGQEAQHGKLHETFNKAVLGHEYDIEPFLKWYKTNMFDFVEARATELLGEKLALSVTAAAEHFMRPPHPRPLAGKRVLITAGPTHEAIDPVRYIANRSSGKQGFAIAAAARAAGAEVILVTGPVELGDPAGVTVTRVESARDMLHRAIAALPVDIAIFAAAVADWRVANEGEQKLKKTGGGIPPLQLVENPDILATISKLTDNRPPLVIGFAAETENLIDNAKAKIKRKGCDWIVANDVSPASGVMGGDRNTVHILTLDKSNVAIDSWPVMTKEEVADALIAKIAATVA